MQKPTVDDNAMRISGVVRSGRIVCIEAFRKEDVKSKNAMLSEILNAEETSVDNGNETSHRRFRWEPRNLEVCFERIIHKSDGEKWGGSLDLFKNFVKEIWAEALDSPGLPFYLIAIQAVLNPAGLNASEDLRKDLSTVYNPIRLSMEKLGGLTSTGTSQSPRVPVLTYLGVRVKSADLRLLQSKAEEVDSRHSISRETLALSERLRNLEPFDLAMQGGDLRSHIVAASNVSLIVGHTYPLGMFGLRTPYVLMLSRSGETLDLDTLMDLPLMPYMPRNPEELMWRGPSALFMPLSILAWSPAFWSDLNGIEELLVRIRSEILTARLRSDPSTILNNFTSAGLKAGSLRIDLGLLKRRFGPTLQAWARVEYPGPKEISVLPTGWGGSHLIDAGFRSGYLSSLAKEIHNDLSRMETELDNVSGEIELLSRYAFEVTSRRSITAMEEAAHTTKRMTIVMIILTGVLVALTGVLVALTLSILQR